MCLDLAACMRLASRRSLNDVLFCASFAPEAGSLLAPCDEELSDTPLRRSFIFHCFLLGAIILLSVRVYIYIKYP